MEDNYNNKDFYWQTVMLEYQNRDVPGYPFIFTNLAQYHNDLNSPQVKHYRALQSKQTAIYYVDDGGAQKLLSCREGECLTHLAQGKTVKNTAEQLGLSPRTVEYYSNRIKEKLNCRNKTELVRKIHRSGLMKKTGEYKQQIIQGQPMEENHSSEDD